MMIRKQGERKSNLDDESLEKLATQVLMQIRRDYGGKGNHAVALHERFIKKYRRDISVSDCKIMDTEIYDILSGCRVRVKPRIREIIKRARGD